MEKSNAYAGFLGLRSVVLESKKLKPKSSMLFLILLLALLQGCIRLAGSAGYWKQGADDEEPEVHQTGFDSQNLLSSNS